MVKLLVSSQRSPKRKSGEIQNSDLYKYGIYLELLEQWKQRLGGSEKH